MFNIQLTSGVYPRFFAGIGQVQSGNACVIATPQLFAAKHFKLEEANRVLETLRSSWPLAQVCESR